MAFSAPHGPFQISIAWFPRRSPYSHAGPSGFGWLMLMSAPAATASSKAAWVPSAVGVRNSNQRSTPQAFQWPPYVVVSVPEMTTGREPGSVVELRPAGTVVISDREEIEPGFLPLRPPPRPARNLRRRIRCGSADRPGASRIRRVEEDSPVGRVGSSSARACRCRVQDSARSGRGNRARSGRFCRGRAERTRFRIRSLPGGMAGWPNRGRR